ncbi:MAG: S-layer homology domain-containing protein [bacterium]|nr:S-layer homology domain-containing protein [bacterium]
MASVALFGMATVHVSGETLNDPEFNSALSWAYENGLTKYNTVDSFMPFANLTREQFAKFAASFAVTNVCLEADTSAACGFSDVPADPTLGDYVTLACQMGLVKGSNGKYMPTANVSKAEVLTVMSRALAAAAGEDAPSEDVTPRWSFHYSAMYSAGITKEIDVNALDRPVTRYEVLLMLYRAKDDESGCSDVDITGLLQDLFGDDVTDTTEVTESNGMVKAMLSPSTPNGVNLPGLVTAKVASFDLTATDEDVVLQEVSLKRMGLGSDSVVSKVTVFANGDVVTKSRSFNSDDEAILSLNPAVTIKKGQTVTIDVVAKVGNSTTVSNEQFAIALFDFATNGQETTSNLPVQANTFGVAGVNGAVVTVTPDGTVSDVNLGDSQVEVAKFQLDNGSDNDVTITSVTLKDDESKADDDLANFTLKHDGETVATSAKTSGKYVTFTLATPVAISQNKSEDFRVYADVTAGAGDQVAFTISQEVYIAGVDAKYGYGIAVSGTDTYTAQTFDILAGDLTLVEHSLDNDQIRENSDNVVLAEFGLNVNAGQDLSLENIKFTANSVSGSVFDNEQLEVTIDGSVRTYDLTESTAGANPTYSDTDLGIYLKAGSDITVRLIADTTNSFEAGWIGDSFAVSMLTSTAGGFKVIENDDDTTVTDIVPSSITFDTIDLVESTVTVARLSLGDVDVVRGAANVDAVKFQVQTDDVSSVFVNSFTLSGDIITSCTGSSGLFNSSLITALRVWMWNGST